jgi:Tfp pilus assembly protein PilO
MNQSAFASHRYKRYYQKLQPLFTSSTAQAYTMIVLSLFCITFFGTFAIRPALKTIATLQRKISDYSELNAQLEAKINSLIQAQSAYEQVAPDLPLIYSLLPVKAEFPSLLRHLENLAVARDATLSGLQFDSIVIYDESESPLTASAAGTPQVVAASKSTPLRFTLSFGGTYENLMLLLDELTKLDRVVTIDSMSLSLGTSSDSTSQLDVTMQSQAYYAP